MPDPRYQYEKVNAIKAVIQNSEGKVLLIQEPETNEWMPGHWGLPGGKPLEKESLTQAFERKMREELGQDIKPDGVIRIEELLIESRTVLMFIVSAKAASANLSGQSKSSKWVGKEDIEQMKTEEFTEFYNKKLLTDFFAENYQLAPMSLFETWKFYELSDDPEYKRWFESGKK